MTFGCLAHERVMSIAFTAVALFLPMAPISSAAIDLKQGCIQSLVTPPVSFERNFNADIAMGRSGQYMAIAYLNHKQKEDPDNYRSPPLDYDVNEVATLLLTEYMGAKNSGLIPTGKLISSGKPTQVPLEARVEFSTELGAWARSRRISDYREWKFATYFPTLSQELATRYRDKIESVKRTSHTGNVDHHMFPEVFRHFLEPYLEKTIRDGGRIHFNLHSSDEAFLRDLNQLPNETRGSQVAKLEKEYFDGVYLTKGSLTRLELLIVASRPALFAATTFYRNYSNPLSAADAQSLWLGPRP